MSRLVGGASPSIGVLTVFLLVTLTFSGVLASPAAFASSASPSFKHIDLLSGDPQKEGTFGWSLSVNGSLVVVGAPRETVDGTFAVGNAYAFNSKTGALVSSLATPHPVGWGQFGYSVAVSGGLVVVGAPGEKSGGVYEAGNAYAFNASTGSLIETFTSPNPQSQGLFGSSVAIGTGIILVGAPQETVGEASQAGDAYVFNTTSGALLYTLDSPNSQTQGYFGYSVAIGGGTAAVGAYYENTEGTAYLFDVNNGSLTQTLVSPNPQGAGYFGWSVATNGKVVVVGAPYETTGQHKKFEAGNAYTFNVQTGSLISELNSDPISYDEFGYSVAISANAVIVSASGGGDGATAYTFNAKTGVLTHTLTNPNKDATGWFGWSVSVSGDAFAVGAPGQNVKHVKSGEAYIFLLGS